MLRKSFIVLLIATSLLTSSTWYCTVDTLDSNVTYYGWGRSENIFIAQRIAGEQCYTIEQDYAFCLQPECRFEP